MSVIEKMLRQLNDKSTSGIYLREIALLMEEIDMLMDELRVKKNLIENYEKQIRSSNAKS